MLYGMITSFKALTNLMHYAIIYGLFFVYRST
jgi:hypothetical protein